MISTMRMLLTWVYPGVHSSYSLISPWLLQWWQIMMRFRCFSIVDFLLNWVHPINHSPLSFVQIYSTQISPPLVLSSLLSSPFVYKYILFIHKWKLVFKGLS
jgi:hypothetical protein